MNKARVLMIVILLGAGVLAGGCGSSTQVQQAPQSTLGQELLDLDKARKEGLITEEEYGKLKKDMIKKYAD